MKRHSDRTGFGGRGGCPNGAFPVLASACAFSCACSLLVDPDPDRLHREDSGITDTGWELDPDDTHEDTPDVPDAWDGSDVEDTADGDAISDSDAPWDSDPPDGDAADSSDPIDADSLDAYDTSDTTDAADTATDADVDCVPDCSGRECGPDPACGFSCGTCPPPEVCGAGGTCDCIPDCLGRECGTDGCGGSCGSCAAPFGCDALGWCTSCPGGCAGRECGPDGCGGSCGHCTGLDDPCDSYGQCTCIPDCASLECGPDPYCGVSCGVCHLPKACNALGECTCTSSCGSRVCGPDPVCGTSCGSCTAPAVCNASGQCVSSCTPSCGTRVCGPDPVCGRSCGTCGSLQYCTSSGQCVTDCFPNCSGRVCGEDGCGGSCGSCATPSACDVSGECVCLQDCDGRECGPDPACGVSCGTCPTPFACNASGRCACTPDCTTRGCGPDPVCGSSCGSCSWPETCSVIGQCGCSPSCEDKECGSDGCSGSCGACAGGYSCSYGLCVGSCPGGTCPGGEWCLAGSCCGGDTWEPSGGDACLEAIDLGVLGDVEGDAIEVTGNLAPGGDEDWYRVSALDDFDTLQDEFSFQVFLSHAPGGLVFDVYRGDCSDPAPCLSVSDCMSWYTDFSRGGLGEDPCRVYSGSGMNLCQNSSSDFYVRVRRASGLPTCDTYQLRISNNPAVDGPGCETASQCDSPGTITPGSTVSGDTSGAANELSGSCGGGVGPEAVWQLVLSTASDVFISAFSTVFDPVVYLSLTCGQSDSGCNDDAYAGVNAAVLIKDNLPAGTYFIVVDGTGPTGGAYSLEVYANANKAAGDACGQPIRLVNGATAGSTCSLTADYSTSCMTTTGNDAVFWFVEETAGTVEFDSCTCAWDTVLAFRNVCTQSSPDLDCDDDWCGTSQGSSVSYAFSPGVYFLALDGYPGACGSCTLYGAGL